MKMHDFNDWQTEHPDDDDESQQSQITATPFIWCDSKSILPRDFLYGHHFIRRYLSSTIATGGVGKSSEASAEIAAMVTGRDLLGIKPKRPLRIWYVNLEDPRDEIDRRLAAVWQHYNITARDIGGRLFIDSGRERKIVIARETKAGLVIAEPVITDILETVQANKIDIIMVDPFVGCYEINENDNSKINSVCQQWATIAEQGRCAIDLCHHVRKGGSRDGHTIDDARGASALINSCRSARILNTMTHEEGEKAGVERHRSYFRIDNGKANLTAPPEQSEWRKFTSVNLDNATAESPADHVGVVTLWKWPDPMDALTVHDLRAAQKAVSEGGPWRRDSQAKNWVGIPIAAALRLEPKDKAHKAKIKGALKVWMTNGMFVEVEGQDEKRMPRTFVEVDKWAND
jgi:AAA domain